MWDPEEFDGITEISLASDAIWVPDVIISELLECDKKKDPHYNRFIKKYSFTICDPPPPVWFKK